MYPTYRLPEHTSIPYAWDFPAAREKKLLLTINGSRRAVDILEIGDLVPFKFQVCRDSCIPHSRDDNFFRMEEVSV